MTRAEWKVRLRLTNNRVGVLQVSASVMKVLCGLYTDCVVMSPRLNSLISRFESVSTQIPEFREK